MSDEKDWPDGWRWYRNPPSHGGEPYLAHQHDVELTLANLRSLVAFHGLALVPAADVPTPISDETLRHLRECALAWEPEARVIGDVTAHQLRAFCLELARLRSAAEAARLVAGSHDNGECSATLNDELSFRLDVLDGDEDALTELARRAAKEAKGG